MQVLYINIPPDFRQGQMSEIILRCRCRQISTFSELHSPTATGSLRNMPSPEQGTSVNITSKNSSNGVKSDGSLLVTTTSGCPHLVRFSASIWERLRITSFATNKLFPEGYRGHASTYRPERHRGRASLPVLRPHIVLRPVPQTWTRLPAHNSILHETRDRR